MVARLKSSRRDCGRKGTEMCLLGSQWRTTRKEGDVDQARCHLQSLEEGAQSSGGVEMRLTVLGWWDP